MSHLRRVLFHYVCFLIGSVFFFGSVVVLSFAASDKQAEDQYTAQVIDELNKKSSVVTTYSVETLKMQYVKGSFTIQVGKKWVAPGNQYRWEGSTYTGGIISDFLIISDGSAVWSKDDLIQAVLKRPVEPNSSISSFGPPVIKSKQSKNGLRVLGKTELKPGQVVYEIECETPEILISKMSNENKSEKHLVKAWIGVADGLLYKVTEYDKSGNETVTSLFRNYELGIPVDPKRFRFEVPHAVPVIDLTQSSEDKNLVTLPVQVKGRKPNRDS